MKNRAPRSQVLSPPLPQRDTSAPAIVETLVMGYIVLVAAGFFVFCRSSAMTRGNQLGSDRAAFIAVNAATLTGFEYSRSTNEYTNVGQSTAFVLMIGGSFLSFLAGGWAVARIARLPYSDAKIARATLVMLLLAAAIGLAGLWGPGVTPFAAIFNGVSALANCGLYLGKTPTANDWTVHILILPLAVIGGLGVPVVIELLDCVFKLKKISTHAWTSLIVTAGIYLSATIILFGLLLPLNLFAKATVTAQDAGTVIGRCYADASVASINARGAGFPFTNISGMPRAAQWIMMALMIVGASSGGVAGGLKVTTLFVLISGARRALRSQISGRLFGIATVWLAGYFAIVMLTFLPLLLTQPEMAADRVLFLAISAASNVGLSHEAVSITGAGLFVLSFGMLLGRLAPLAVLWWVARTANDAEIAVG